MKTDLGQSLALDTQTDTPSPLTRRLLRRASEPAGVIDVFQSQRQYARTEGWVGQHFPLLQRITARAQQNDAMSDNDSLLLASRAQTAEADVVSPFSNISIGSSRTAAPAMRSAAVTDAVITPPPQYRISRRASSATLKIADDVAIGAPEEASPAIVSVSSGRAAPAAPAFSKTMPLTVIQRERAKETDSGLPPAVVQTTPGGSAITHSPVAMLMRKPAQASVAETVQASPSSVAQITEPLSQPVAAVSISRSIDAAASVASPLLKLANPTRATRLNRQIDLHQSAPTAQHSLPAAGTPVTAASPQQPVTLVWRKASIAEPGSASHRLAPQPVAPAPTTPARTEIARQIAEQEVDPMPASASSAPSAPGATQSDSLPSLDKITEHVSRAILRQLAVERERRGMSS